MENFRLVGNTCFAGDTVSSQNLDQNKMISINMDNLNNPLVCEKKFRSLDWNQTKCKDEKEDG